MNNTRTSRKRALEEQLARYEATGELPLGSQLNEVVSKVDRYLQAIAQVRRLRPGDTTGRGPKELGKAFGGYARAMSSPWPLGPGRSGKGHLRWPAA